MAVLDKVQFWVYLGCIYLKLSEGVYHKAKIDFFGKHVNTIRDGFERKIEFARYQEKELK